MIYTIKLFLFALNIWNPIEAANFQTEERNFTVEIDNIKNTSGQVVRIAVSKKADFLGDGTPFRYAVVTAKSNKISETFKLPAGDYAVSIYHDLNGNGKMDKNFFGAPNEPYGFSKNYKPTFRAPRFDEVKINVNSDKKISISLIQP